MSVSLILSIPPDSDTNLASKDISLFLSWRIGSNITPDPLPPSIVVDITLFISKSWGSTNTSDILPVTTGLINALVLPAPGPVNVIFGGFKTS